MTSIEVSEGTLRAAVVNLLIHKIGEEWNIGDLKSFDVSESKPGESKPGIYFLGLNKETNKLHWIFLNNNYQATIVVNGLDIEKEIETTGIKQFLKKSLGDKYIDD